MHSAYHQFSGNTCATVLDSLGARVTMDGTHIGRSTASLLKEFYKNRSVNLNLLTFDESFEGLEDYILISGDARTPLGTFGHFFVDAYKNNIKHWNKHSQAFRRFGHFR